ncbi:hypothetical protein ACP275_01G081600 [Erythranthe tilingii]
MAIVSTKSFFVFFVLVFALVNKEGDQMVEGREIVSPGPTLAPSVTNRLCSTTIGKCSTFLGNYICRFDCNNTFGGKTDSECIGVEPGAPHGYCVCYYNCL